MKKTKQIKLTSKQRTLLRASIVTFLVNETWPFVVEDFLGTLKPHGWHYCLWYPESLAAMRDGDYGKVIKGVHGSRWITFQEYNRERNYPITIWNSGGQVNDPPLSWCDLSYVPREHAEYLVNVDDVDENNIFVKGEEITEKELKLVAKGWEYVVRTGPDDPEPLLREIGDKLGEIVEARLDLLLTPDEQDI
jgi:hypothetical protein